jgi:Ni/Fe-hydrogenase b-type cytochrome subunit
MTAPGHVAEPHALRERARGKPGYRWVYLWHWPVRAMHWVSTLSIVTLVVTGFYIGKPYFMTGGEASAHFLMGWTRLLHFIAAGVFVATALARVYWLFIGNRYERWQALIPLHRRQDWTNLKKVARKYILVYPRDAPHFLGHNPIQQLVYTGLYAVAITQILTGFAMYGLAGPGGFFFTTFHWIVPLFGGVQRVHFVHHVLTWVFVIFLPIHIYNATRADLLHREGRLSSMVSGGRFVRDDVAFVDD